MSNALKRFLMPRRWALWAGLLCFMPGGLWAADQGLNLFTVDPQDESLRYMGLVFGQVGTLLNGEGNPMLNQLFLIFNTGLFTVGVVFITYGLFTSLIKTAYDGQALGKNSSLFLTPVKIGIGLLLMLPSKTGYSFLQIFFMWAIINSIGAANQMWATVNQYSKIDDAIQASDENLRAAQTVPMLLQIAACAEEHNRNHPMDEPITLRKNTSGAVPVLEAGTTRNPRKCGSLGVKTSTLKIAGQNVSNAIKSVVADVYLDSYIALYLQAGSLVSDFYDEHQALQGSSPPDLTPYRTGAKKPSAQDNRQFGIYNDLNTLLSRNINQGGAGLVDRFRNMGTLSNEADQKALTKFMEQNNEPNSSWIRAGSYYFTFIQAERSREELSHFEPDFRPPTPPPLALPGVPSHYTDYFVKKYTSAEQAVRDPQRKMRPVEPVNGEFLGISVFPAINKFVKKLAVSLTTHDQNPLISLAGVGNYIIQVLEIMFFATLAAIIAVALFGWCPCINSFTTAARAVINIWIGLYTILLSLLWVAASMLAYYLPLIPYLVFLFATISWFITVIEAMLAAPLVAMTFLIPSQDEFGKTAVAMGLLSNLFFRPTLMVVGLALGGHLMTVAVGMLNFGFIEALNMNTGYFGIFAWLAFLMIYVTTVSTIINESFSLVYVIPDKLLRMMGGQAEMSQVAQLVQKVKQGHDQGAQMSQQAATGATELVKNTTNYSGG